MKIKKVIGIFLLCQILPVFCLVHDIKDTSDSWQLSMIIGYFMNLMVIIGLLFVYLIEWLLTSD